MQRGSRAGQRGTVAAAALALALAAGSASARGAKTVHREIPVTTAHEYYQYHAARGFTQLVVLDVRPADKRGGVAIKGARALPFVDASSRKAFAALDGRPAYMIYCADGKRAARALQLMRELHFREVYSIQGGLQAWTRKRYPTESLRRGAQGTGGGKAPAPPR